MDARRANGVTIIKEGMVIQMNARIPNKKDIMESAPDSFSPCKFESVFLFILNVETVFCMLSDAYKSSINLCLKVVFFSMISFLGSPWLREFK